MLLPLKQVNGEGTQTVASINVVLHIEEEMEPPVRFELTTVRLQGECSTN